MAPKAHQPEKPFLARIRPEFRDAIDLLRVSIASGVGLTRFSRDKLVNLLIGEALKARAKKGGKK